MRRVRHIWSKMASRNPQKGAWIHIFGPGRSKTSPAGPPGQPGRLVPPGRPVGCFAGGEGGKSAGEGQRRGEAGAPPLLSPQVGYLVPNNPPAVIGVGGLQPLLCAAPPLRSSLLPLPQSSPPGGQAGPGGRAGPAGRPGSSWTALDQKCGSKLPFVDFWMPFWTKYVVHVSKK